MTPTNIITVKCLSELTKNYIVADYKNKHSIKLIAEEWLSTPRTVGRVLVERGVATPVARLKGEAYRVMQLLKTYNITPDQLEALFVDASKPVPKNIRQNHAKQKQAALFRPIPQQQTAMQFATA